ncbi:MAG: glycosyltransferase [Pseudomonadales bacterium]|nr:glycosyltransferase [Pseudomonadales bacterium]
MKEVTIIITPRDRFSGIIECIENIYQHTDTALFELIILDLGYPRALREAINEKVSQLANATVIDYGLVIPMESMRSVREHINTPFTVFLDNDSRVTKNWLAPLLDTAKSTGAAVISPLTLEKEGVDEGGELRNHIYTSELRIVDAENQAYLIEHKPFRRALPEEIPQEVRETQAFELHCVMFRTDALKAIELPQMTMREHLDIGMQLRAKGEKLVAEPRSVVHFDNLGTRADLSDLKYFNFRWNRKICEQSSRLFEKRWGYKFYNEDAIYFWAERRRIFLILRTFYIPISIANKIDRVFRKIKTSIKPIWDPLPDPYAASTLLYETLPEGIPQQQSHDIY